MGKKIIGYVFFLLGILCVLSFIVNIISLIIGRRGNTNTEFYEIVAAVVITVFLDFIFFKYCYKWTKRKPQDIDDIDSIGK